MAYLHNLKAAYASVFRGTAELRKKKKKRKAKKNTELRNIVFNADIQCYTVSNSVEHKRLLVQKSSKNT